MAKGQTKVVEEFVEIKGEDEAAPEVEGAGVDVESLVWVRVKATMGILAGRAVWAGELHRVWRWQYELAVREAGQPGLFELVEIKS